METSPIFYLCILLTTLIFILVSILFHYTHQNQKHGFKLYPFFGTLPDFLCHRHRFLDWTTTVLADHPTHTAVFFRPGKVHTIMTANPAVVEHVLKNNFLNYPKGPKFSALLFDFLGVGIFNVDEELWKHQRKTASFEFNKRSLKTFLLDVTRSEISTRLIPLLERGSVGSSGVLDMQDVLERFAFDSVCKLAFNVDPGCLSGSGEGESEFMRAFEEASTLSSGRFMYLLPVVCTIKKFFNVGSEKRLKEAIRTVHVYADNIIRSRLEEIKNGGDRSSNRHDLLSRFIESSDSNSYDCAFLRDVVISFILAGRDTTSSGLSWFFWLLSSNPTVLEKIRTEVRNVRTRAGKRVGDTFDFDELREMNYLHGALSETLRLYPPVPVDTRTCLEDDILPDGTTIKRDWFVTYHTYAMGRMESIWGQDCLQFRPERWLDENGVYKPDNPFRFPVFHAGPRICLGKEVAYIQMKSIAACVVEQFDIDVLEKENRPEFLLSLTLRMKNGLPVKIRKTNVRM
ncbi:cytochrome P450 CYP94D108-like [Silene latifolia]|uniref:cytochrome P450 CYP94D108-like n=1 Tax=Silene latifolia TaxID=37657 RepID=UPI003D784BB9